MLTQFYLFFKHILRYFYSRFTVIEVNKLLSHSSWLTSGIRTSCQHNRVLYLKLRNNNNPVFMKYFKNYCRILSKVIKEAKRMECDRHILNSDNVMRTSWKLINRELGKDCKNYGLQSLNINGRCITSHQIIVNAFNEHFTTLPTTISQNINASNCSTTTSDNHSTILFSLNHVYQNSFPNIKYHCTTTRETENVIKTLKLSNSCGYDEVPSKLLILCSPLNYIRNRTLFTGVFPDRLKYATIRP